MANMRPYDVAISDAIQKSDARKLEAMIEKARQLHQEQAAI